MKRLVIFACLFCIAVVGIACNGPTAQERYFLSEGPYRPGSLVCCRAGGPIGVVCSYALGKYQIRFPRKETNQPRIAVANNSALIGGRARATAIASLFEKVWLHEYELKPVNNNEGRK